MGGGEVAILVRNYIDTTEVDTDIDDICAITTTIDRNKTCIISCYWGFAHGGIPNTTQPGAINNQTREAELLDAYARITTCIYRTTTTSQPFTITLQTVTQYWI